MVLAKTPVSTSAVKRWLQEDWKNVSWTVELKLEVFGTQRRTFVRCRKNDKMLEECLMPECQVCWRKGEGLGCFGGAKVGDSYIINVILSKEAMPFHTLWMLLNWSQNNTDNRTKTQSTALNNAGTIQRRSRQLVFCLMTGLRWQQISTLLSCCGSSLIL